MSTTRRARARRAHSRCGPLRGQKVNWTFCLFPRFARARLPVCESCCMRSHTAEFNCANTARKTALPVCEKCCVRSACGVQLRKYCMQDRAACMQKLLHAKCGLLPSACGAQLRKYCMQDRAACMRKLLHAKCGLLLSACGVQNCMRNKNCRAESSMD